MKKWGCSPLKIYRQLEDYPQSDRKTGIALGTFDGLHMGHRELIKTLVDHCKSRGLTSVLYTFSNHPREVVDSEKSSSRILTLSDKMSALAELGVDEVVIVNFDDYHRHIRAIDFIQSILIQRLKAALIVVGYNFRFGRHAEGDISLLAQFEEDFELVVLEPVFHGNELVSSSHIRSLLSNGYVENAAALLGKPYRVQGTIVTGKQVGKKLGFPTANLHITEDMTHLKPGVYITRTHLEHQVFESLTNVGFNPTFDQKSFNIETYILDFDANVYGHFIAVDFLKRIRDEMKFEKLEDLIAQIESDVTMARSYFETHEMALHRPPCVVQ